MGLILTDSSTAAIGRNRALVSVQIGFAAHSIPADLSVLSGAANEYEEVQSIRYLIETHQLDSIVM